MTAPDDLARILAAQRDEVSRILVDEGRKGGWATQPDAIADAVLTYLASVVSRRDADLRTRIEAICAQAAPAYDARDYLAETEQVIREHGEPLSPERLAHAVFTKVEGGLVQCGWNQAAVEISAALDGDTREDAP